MSEIAPASQVATNPASKRPDPLMEAAKHLEGAFLAEMLKMAGFGAARQSFGGGVGEDQFSSMLRDVQARSLAGAGGIGLAEAIYRSMSLQSRRGEADEG